MTAVLQPKNTLDTPVLIVDLDVLESNIARIANTCREHGVAWRPHTKGQKTPEIVFKEIHAGAIGIACAKLGEAEVMADAGLEDILIANQIVGATKIGRLMALNERTNLTVSVDNLTNLEQLALAAERRKPLRVVVEVDIGMRRAGVQPGEPTIELVDAIARHRPLEFVGVMAWESHAVTIADAAEKERAVAAAIALLTRTARACSERGHSVNIVSCGGSGTFPYCIRQPGVTEVQIGGAIFSGIYYRREQHLDFPCALTILATVTSRPTPSRIVIDAGVKSMSSEWCQPMPIGLPPIRQLRLSSEHTTIELVDPAETPRVGETMELAVGYSDTTINLHDEIAAVRGGKVEAIWRVAARGKTK